MEPISVPLRSRRRERGLLVQKVQHVIPAMALFVVGMQALKERAHGGELALAILSTTALTGSRSAHAGRRRILRDGPLHSDAA